MTFTALHFYLALSLLRLRFRLLSPSSRHRSVSLRREKKKSHGAYKQGVLGQAATAGEWCFTKTLEERETQRQGRLWNPAGIEHFALNICDSISQSRSASRCGCELNVGGILRVSFLLKIAADYSSKSKIMSERQSKLRNISGGSGGFGENCTLFSFVIFLSNQKSDYKWIRRQFQLNLYIISLCRRIAIGLHPSLCTATDTSSWGLTLTVFPFLCAVCGRMPVVGGICARPLVGSPGQGGPVGCCRAAPGSHMLPLQRRHSHHALLGGVRGCSCPRAVHAGTHAVQGLHDRCVGCGVDGRWRGVWQRDANEAIVTEAVVEFTVKSRVLW